MALSCNVLVVCVANIKEDGDVFDWSVYIDAVPGICHANEYMQVARTGQKQTKKLGIVFYPGMDATKYRR